MKKIGLAVLMITLAPAAFAAGTYIEVWNPLEARATAPHRIRAAHKLATHWHVVPHAVKVKVRARRTSTPAPKLVTKRNNMQKSAPIVEHYMFEIPRQITPEGNVLRVTAQGTSAEVVR